MKKKGERERKRLWNKLEQFEMCLGSMAVTSDNTDFMQYTSEWFHRVNRGGLFPINDETLRFFVSVEMVTRQHLPQQCSSENQEPIKECVIRAILEDVDVQFLGALISQDICEEQDSFELLTEISDMWVTVRGFSIASTWLEEYKKVKKTSGEERKYLYHKVQGKTNTCTYQ